MIIENGGKVYQSSEIKTYYFVREKIIDQLDDYQNCTAFKYKETGIDNHPYKANIIKSFRYLNPDLENYSDAEIWQSFSEDFQEIYSA